MPFPELFRDEVFRIETKRLWLRWPRPSDARALTQIASQAGVAEKTATWPHPMPDQEADWRILRAREGNASGSRLVFAITRKKHPDVLAGIISAGEDKNGGLDLGYLLDPQFHGRGLMTEAVYAVIGVTFAYTGYQVIRASSGLNNPASRRVLEKSGFRSLGDSLHDAPARGGSVSCDDFELTRVAWKAAGEVIVRPEAA